MLEPSTRTTDSNFQSTQHFKMDFGPISTMGKSSSPGPGTPIAEYTLVVAVYSYLLRSASSTMDSCLCCLHVLFDVTTCVLPLRDTGQLYKIIANKFHLLSISIPN